MLKTLKRWLFGRGSTTSGKAEQVRAELPHPYRTPDRPTPGSLTAACPGTREGSNVLISRDTELYDPGIEHAGDCRHCGIELGLLDYMTDQCSVCGASVP